MVVYWCRQTASWPPVQDVKPPPPLPTFTLWQRRLAAAPSCDCKQDWLIEWQGYSFFSSPQMNFNDSLLSKVTKTNEKQNKTPKYLGWIHFLNIKLLRKHKCDNDDDSLVISSEKVGETERSGGCSPRRTDGFWELARPQKQGNEEPSHRCRSIWSDLRRWWRRCDLRY